MFKSQRRHSQVVRPWIANSLFPSSNLGAAFKFSEIKKYSK
jgi:hypothetical protein